MRPRDRERRRPTRHHAFRPDAEGLEHRITLSADIGVNLDFNFAGTANPIWTDLHNLAKSWAPTSGSTLSLSPDGYPLASATTAFTAGNYPAGNYKFSYTGAGTVSFSDAARLVGSVTVSGGVTSGTVAFSHTLGDGTNIDMQVTNVNASNPMDNFHLMMPGYGNGTTAAPMYTPAFLQLLKPFSTIRFMNWTMVNSNPVANWSGRVGPNAFITDGNGGVPYEDMIELCNEAQKDMWLNIPVDTTPAFVQSLAQLVASKLDSNLNVYVEYGNEVWAGSSFDYGQVYAAAKANPVLNQSLGGLQLVAQQTAYTLVNDGQIFDQAFGSASARVRPVFGGQSSWTAFASYGLPFIQQQFGAPSKYIYGLAVAPYVGLQSGQNVAGLTLNQLFADLNGYLNSQIVPQVQNDAALAKQYGVPLIAYEGGQGLGPGANNVNFNLIAAAQTDPRMYQLYVALINDWQQAGGQLFTAYQLTGPWNKYGFWGMVPDATATGSPRYDALVSTMYSPGDINLNGSVNYADLQVLEANYDTGGAHWTQGDLNQDGLVDAADLNAMRQLLNLSGLTLGQFAQEGVFGQPANIQAGTALEYDAFGATYASSMPLASSTGTVKMNENSAGQPIVLGAATYSEGLGFAANSSATFALNGLYATFDSTIGVDSSGSTASSVIFQVFGDGKLLYQSPTMAYGATPVPIEVNVAKVQKLTLMVEAAPGSTAANDHAAWGDARLVSTANLGSSPYTLNWQLSHNGTVVSTQTADSFSFAALQGTYTVTLTVTNSAGQTAKASSTVTAVSQPKSTASSIHKDTTTLGSWIGTYGGQGYDIAGVTPSLPSYASVSIAGAGTKVWTTATSDAHALELPGGSQRLASAWYSDQGGFSINVDFTDGQVHDLALYAIDWTNAGLKEQIQVINATTGGVLDTETISSFRYGAYLQWPVVGAVTIKVSGVSSPSAVISGLFLDSPTVGTTGTATATFEKEDATTQGTWIGAYGGQGDDIEGSTASLPSYAAVSFMGASTWTWAASTTDARALQTPGGSGRAATTWYSSSSAFTIDVNLTDGQVHDLALYAVDWDKAGRSERVQVADAASGAVLDTETLSSFGGGAYLRWAVSGHVQIRVTNLAGGPNAVVSGLFLDPPTIGTTGTTFVKEDATTQGTWIGAYGGQGDDIEGSTASLPSYATVSFKDASTWTWAASTTDARALQTPGGSGRTATTWYSSSSAFTIDVNLTDGQVHDLALYAVNWDKAGRSEQFQVVDATTGAVLDTETLSSFGGGAYLRWAVSGHVQIRVTHLAGGPNAVVSGLFLDPASA